MMIGATVAGCDREKQASEQVLAPSDAASSAAQSGAAAQPAGAQYQIDRSHKGEMAPDAPFSGPKGEAVRLRDFAGQPLLINLWATWCAPCVAEMPTLDALATKWQGQRHVIAVSQDLQGAAIVGPWVEKAGLKAILPYSDAENALMDHYNSVLPTTIYYDREGRELWRVVGALDWMGEEAAALLNEAN